MKALTCGVARRLLGALHDGELPIDQQVAVNAHVEWCDSCRSALSDLSLVRSTIRTAMSRKALSRDEDVGLRAAIIGRVKAEKAVSFGVVVRDMFQDMHFVYAGLGGVAAVLMCLAVTSVLLHAATMRPNELADLIRGLEAPESDVAPVALGASIQMPRAVDAFATAARLEHGDAVVAVKAVVTRDGRVASLELLRAHGTPWIAPGNDEATLVNGMLGVASATRFAPASVAGLPVAADVVWIVAQTTVRGTPGLPIAPAVRRPSA